LVRQATNASRRRTEIYPRNPPRADINFMSSNGISGLPDMWETNTLKASFHARLNVASGAGITLKSR
jgi:hypothetical protein